MAVGGDGLLAAAAGEKWLQEYFVWRHSWPRLLLLSFLLWSLVLLLVWIAPLSLAFKRQHADRVASCVHAIASTACGVAVALCAEPTCITLEQDRWVVFPQTSTAGWLCVDVCSMIYMDVVKRWRAVDISVFVHHVVIVFVLIWSANFGIGQWFQGVTLVMESSVLPLNALQFLRFHEMEETTWYRISRNSTAVLWLISRILLIPYLVWRLQQQNYCMVEWGSFVSLGARLTFLVLFILNFYWMVKLAKKALEPAKKVR
eukprot:TRINITY_DN9375_c0_g1_i3.p1 TRINITY_DN9375_c0_g1~~TRINITY_DN9375_c0_g1_i3.p1  ORF type:complete len:295 (+),score=42.87 TRINITY_DN9375_c0_g1_i3:109-885(+)